MLQKKFNLLIIGVVSLLSGCYEVDLLSLEIKEDLSSTLEFVVINTNKELQEVFQNSRKELEKCGFETREQLTSSNNQSFIAIQNFPTQTSLERVAKCNYFTNLTVKINTPIKKEGILGTTFKQKIELLPI